MQASEIAALAASVTIYGALIAFSLAAHKRQEGESSLLIASLAGVVLCIVAFISNQSLLRNLALGYFAIVVLAIALPVVRDGLRKKQWRWPTAATWIWERPKSLLVGFGLVLVAALGIAIGAAVFGKGTTVTTVTAAASGRYRISGTCANGSCYVNECRTPAVCGSGNVGELKEETAVDIVCQTKGERTKAPNGRHSDVWDRLSAHVYVSDLFVSGTRNGTYAPHLPRCAGG
jgi:hypothetical protein